MSDRLITADEARALREAATPGPWAHVVYTRNDAAVYVEEDDPDQHEHPRTLIAGGVTGMHDAALIAAAPDLAATVEALHAEIAELRATLAAERGDPAGALPGWRVALSGGERGSPQSPDVSYRRCSSGGWDVVSCHGRGVIGWFHTAREAMRAADASVVPRG